MVLGIEGSPRPKGNSHRLLQALMAGVHDAGVSSFQAHLRDYRFDFADTKPREWASRLSGQGRKAIIGSIAEQEEKKDMGFALEAMRLPLQALGYQILAEFPVLRLFDRGIISQETDLLKQAKTAGRELAMSVDQRL